MGDFTEPELLDGVSSKKYLMVLVYSSSEVNHTKMRHVFHTGVRKLATNGTMRGSLERSILTSFEYIFQKLFSEKKPYLETLEEVLGFGTIDLEVSPRLQMDLNLRQVPELILFQGSLRRRVIRNEDFGEDSMEGLMVHFLRDTVMRHSKLIRNEAHFLDPTENGEKYAFICNRDFAKLEGLQGLFSESVSKRSLSAKATRELKTLRKSLSSSEESLRRVGLIEDAFKLTKTNSELDPAHLFLISDVQTCTDLGVDLDNLVAVSERRAKAFTGEYTFGDLKNFLLADPSHIPDFHGSETLREIVKFEKPVLVYVSLEPQETHFDKFASFWDFKKVSQDPMAILNMHHFFLLKLRASDQMWGFGGDWNHWELFEGLRVKGQAQFEYDDKFLIYYIDFQRGTPSRYVYTSDFGKKVSSESIQKFYFAVSNRQLRRVLATASDSPLVPASHSPILTLNIDSFQNFLLSPTSIKIVLFLKSHEVSGKIFQIFQTVINTFFMGVYRINGKRLLTSNFRTKSRIR
jgi:hypothetical protein